MKLKDIIVEEKPPIATIWLNHPERKNSIDTPMLHEIIAAIQSFEKRLDIKAIVLRGKGETWCAGWYLNELDQEKIGGGSRRNTSLSLLRLTAGHLIHVFDYTPQITLVAVNGYAVAGGFELMMLADLAIATEDAKIGDFHIRRALWGGSGPLWSVARVVGIRKAKELMLSGKLLSGKEAYDFGLVNKVVPPDKLDEGINEFLEPFVDKSAWIQQLGKMCLNRTFEASKETLAVMEQLLLLNIYESDDAKEGVEAFLQKRKPVWKDQ